ncbi:MAG TPA: TIGR03809 family protein [Xanthobacteraceae bacterium]|nr:TIGR03809 family protein [Xanthobacteraceae bacterium]
MAHRLEAALGRQLLARWRMLAERRLSYLVELRDTGRWQRFYSDAALLDNITDAERAVMIFRSLAPSDGDAGAQADSHLASPAVPVCASSVLPPQTRVAGAAARSLSFPPLPNPQKTTPAPAQLRPAVLPNAFASIKAAEAPVRAVPPAQSSFVRYAQALSPEMQ